MGACVWVEVDVGTESEGGAEFGSMSRFASSLHGMREEEERAPTCGRRRSTVPASPATPDKERNRSDSPPLAHLVYCIVHFRFCYQ